MFLIDVSSRRRIAQGKVKANIAWTKLKGRGRKKKIEDV